MSKKQRSDKRSTTAKPVRRREALKGLGALAITAPTFAALGCSNESPTGGMNSPVGSSAGTGASVLPSATAGMPAAAAGNTSTATGVAGTGAAGQGTATGTGASGTGAAGVQAPPASGAAGSTGPSTSTAGNGAAAGTGPGASAGSGGPAAAGGSPTPAGAGGGSAAGSGGAGASMGDFIPVMFDDAASCTLTPTDPAGEGPFFVHEDEVMNDESLMRSDTREGKPGVELQLNLRVLDSDGKCMTPISGVEVYIWHTDATGFYSAFNGQNPDMSYSGAFERTVENDDRFCRGIQITDPDGIVRFRTLYPGWYNGRAIHIHFVALRPGSGASTMSYRSSQYMVFTTQMYFAEQFSRMIHENNDPYKKRASGSAYNQYVKPQNMTVNPTMRMEGAIAVGALNIVTSGKGSRR